jgi:hypothetical protein
MNAHEAPGAPMNSNVFCDFSWNPFFHTNAACKLYGQPLFSQLLIYHLGRLVLHVFNSWKFCFKQMLKNNVCFPPFCAGLAPRKNCPLPVLQHMSICRYTCIDFKKYVNR